jgi:signal peptidase I
MLVWRSILACGLTSVLASCGCTRNPVVSSSMSPTIKAGSKVTVDWTAYAGGTPKRWDVVCFEPPMYSNQVWVMRIVGLPGDRLSFSTGAITLNGHPLNPPSFVSNVNYVSLDYLSDRSTSIASPYIVPTNCFFVLGDNSSNALDSRFWGPVSRSNIFGKVKGI